MESKDKFDEEIKRIENKKVKDRTEQENLFLLQWKHEGKIRNYLLSMGEFTDERVK